MREQEIIEQIINREHSGMDAMLRHYGPLMRYIIAPILPNEQDREECLSEAAMRVWDKIELFDRRRGSWNAWLTAIVRNTALNRARQNQGRAEDIPEDTPSGVPTPEEAVIRKERQDALKNVLQKLSPAKRTLLYRKYYYSQSTAQIASELGMTERAVEGKLYRLRKQLRGLLGGEGDE